LFASVTILILLILLKSQLHFMNPIDFAWPTATGKPEDSKTEADSRGMRAWASEAAGGSRRAIGPQGDWAPGIFKVEGIGQA
jgi:hypothetical protein